MRRQCEKCPWKVFTDSRRIPNGYSEEKHRALKSTIAKPASVEDLFASDLHIMACHETHDAPCVGWLHHQLGRGNNLALRMRVYSGHIDADVQVVGEQHKCLEDTFPNL